MPVPKKRLSATRSGNRRSHLRLNPRGAVACSHCQAPVRPHTVCLQCGYYKGVRVLPQKATKS